MNATVRPGTQPDRRYRIHKNRIEVPGVDARVDTLVGMVMQLMSEVCVCASASMRTSGSRPRRSPPRPQPSTTTCPTRPRSRRAPRCASG